MEGNGRVRSVGPGSVFELSLPQCVIWSKLHLFSVSIGFGAGPLELMSQRYRGMTVLNFSMPHFTYLQTRWVLVTDPTL